MKSIVFDLDGTLIDSAPDIHAAVNRLLVARGSDPLEFAVVRGFIGNGAGVLLEKVAAAVGLAPDAARHADWMHHFLEDYETAVHLTVLYPHAEDALRALAAEGWSIGLCTNKPMAPTRAILRHFGILDLFGAVVGGDSLPQRKPDPAPLRAVLDSLGGHPAVYVGDSEVDAECAHRAGVPMALYTEGYRKTALGDLPHAHAFDDFRGLPQAAETLLRL